ncbi:MAG: MotA/TolQ/ExbB proton channel family protein [Candidatus Latescibacterota bacterium]|jgi:biopolymer transport protein ExbB
MRRQKTIVLVVVGVILAFASLTRAQDVREAAKKAEAEYRAALEEKKRTEQQIINDRSKLLAEVERLEAQQRQLELDLAAIGNAIERNDARLEKLEDDWGSEELDTKEISGNVRVLARELETTLQQSQLTAIYPQRLEKIAPLLDKGYFPGIDDIVTMTRLYFDEIERSGQVGLVEAGYVGRNGEDEVGKVLTLGKFTALYKEDDEVGFLRYSEAGHKFFALSALPSRGTKRQIGKYFAGQSDVVPIDMSGGAALRQITHKVSFWEQIESGGPIVYPIGLLALVALIIVINRIIYLNNVNRNTAVHMTEINRLAADGDWEECESLVMRHKGKHSPVNHVLEAGIYARNEDRETLESILQEAILREMPRVERGLSVLAILGVVAPLLGLLGTVTGMIDTFRVITLFGTGDPKLMSGGISEALVTTMLGLAVAIPIMLLHTYLARRANHIIGQMEEKAVTLVNIVEKQKAEEKRQRGVAA